jgi:organic radical activating enzyme
MNNKQTSETIWMKQLDNDTSKTFCAAKWYNATIWLGNGMTASCHHPPPHKIDPEEIKQNPSALHNTQYKKLVRREMQNGIQTKECDYCWKMENLEKDLVSDRYYKSSIYKDDEISDAYDLPWDENASLKTLEISFDSNCNLACGYCNAGFSTTWAHDINENGPYQNLRSDGWGAFAHNGKWAMPNGPANKDNPYIDAFWKWWEDELQYSLTEIRITGGEPTMSPHFWKFMDWFDNNPSCNVKIGINSNLIIKKTQLDKLCKLSKQHTLEIYTSNESMGNHAEYIRDGLSWDQWKTNFNYIIENGSFNHLHVMSTINALCLASLDKFIEELIEMRTADGIKTSIHFSLNILRFPSFQSITTLPEAIRNERAAYYRNWLGTVSDKLSSHERVAVERTIAYIEEILDGHNVQPLSELDIRQKDFVSFHKQYDERRGKDFKDTFSEWPALIEFFDSVNIDNHINRVNKMIEGNAVDWGLNIYNEVLQNATDEGVIK